MADRNNLIPMEVRKMQSNATIGVFKASLEFVTSRRWFESYCLIIKHTYEIINI